jgi:hypothetical protein
MKRHLQIAFGGCILLAATAVWAGPFGLEMGMMRAQIEALIPTGKLQDTGDGIYKTTRLPRMHDAFESFLLLIDDQHGLCKVTAIGKTINTSVYGDELRDAFNRLEADVARVYGRNRKYDFLKARSIWNERRDWMMGLLKKERILAAYWT